MYTASVLTHVVIGLAAIIAFELDSNQNGYDSKTAVTKAKIKQKVTSIAAPHYNVSYLDVSQNIKRIPFNNEQFELNSINKKKKKKNPKRTIQKIIKRNKAKNKKLHYHTETSVTKKQTLDVGRHYMIDDDISNRNDNIPSTQSPKKKPRKTHTKIIARNPKPFHQLYQMRRPNNQRRYKRNIERDNAYIIQDLDEIKFIGNSNDYDTVNVHVKNYW